MKLLKETKKKPVPKEKKKEQKMFEEKEMFEILQSSYQVKVFSTRICRRVCDSKIRKIKNTKRKIWCVNSIKNHFSSNNKYKENHQIADVIYTEPHILPHHLHRPFPWQEDRIMFWRLCSIEPGLQRWELSEISTMLPALIKKSIRQFIYCHHHSPGLQPHLSTRWTGQTRLTNSQGAIHESWMTRCSPRAPAFSREQYTWYFYSLVGKYWC